MPAKAPILEPVVHQRLIQLGEAFRVRRKTLGITAVAAAEAAGMSRVTWHRLEKGEPSLTLGAWANAARVLGLVWPLDPADPDVPAPPPAGHWLPLDVRLEDYPELRRLAWQVQGRATLTPREALGIYERNLRHLDESAMPTHERELLAALRKVFGSPDV